MKTFPDIPRPVIRQLLKIRDALILDDTRKAYRLLYEMADPEGKKGRQYKTPA